MRKTRRDLLRETRPLCSITVDDLHEVRKRGKKGALCDRVVSVPFGAAVKPGRTSK